MSYNPLNELKRRLEDDSVKLPKRLCLAKNVVQTHHFPAFPKDKVIGDWLKSMAENNKISTHELRAVLSWVEFENITVELKINIIQIVAYYVQNNIMETEDIANIMKFMANEKITDHFSNHVKEFLLVSKMLLNSFKKEDLSDEDIDSCEKILNNYTKCYKDCKRKHEFIVNLIQDDNINAILNCLEVDALRATALKVCQAVLFSQTRKQFYSILLQWMIRKESIEELISEKGDNMKTVMAIMSIAFKANDKASVNAKILKNFIDVFVHCFKSESQLIFAFYINIINSLNLKQDYINSAFKLAPVIFDSNDEKEKRKLFLNMLQILLQNDVDISVRLTDTLGDKPKNEMKKNFIGLLEAVMSSQIKLEKKLDKISLEIIIVALKLDPVLIEKSLNKMLPVLMIMKKNNSNVKSNYVEMMNCLMETLFKLSRGVLFFKQVLPHLKLTLEECDHEQSELSSLDNGEDLRNLKTKIIDLDDILPSECIEKYGQLTSELMFRQNTELLNYFKNDFENHCLSELENGVFKPSAFLVADVLSAILFAFFENCKMADHTVPDQIADDFWSVFRVFEMDVLRRFGDCLHKFYKTNSKLLHSFLKLCLGYAQLKLLSIQYSHLKTENEDVGNTETVHDLSAVLPFFNHKQWREIGKWDMDVKCTSVFDKLLLVKVIYNDLKNIDSQKVVPTKSYLLDRVANDIQILDIHYQSKVILSNLTHDQMGKFSKTIVKTLTERKNLEILTNANILNSKPLSTIIAMDIIKLLVKELELPADSKSLAKAISKENFSVIQFFNEVNFIDYFSNISGKKNLKDDEAINMTFHIECLKHLQIHNLEENVLLTVILVSLALKKATDKRKLRKNVDYLLQMIFEMTPKCPDLYKIIPVDYMFAFPENTFLELATLKLKTNRMLVVKCILEVAVKKVKTDSDYIKKIVKILISNQKNRINSSIDYFSDDIFQISCIVLPLIAKEKKAITAGAYRSILATLQEKLHKSLLKCFKTIDFSNENSLFMEVGNPDESVYTDHTLATLNAMEAYTLTLAKYCETSDVEEIKNLECLWAGLGFFVENAISSIDSKETKLIHVESSIQLLNAILRYTKKLDSHEIFKSEPGLLSRFWKCIVNRFVIACEKDRYALSEDVGVSVKFVAELATVEAFGQFVGDISAFISLKEYTSNEIQNKNTITSHNVAKLLWLYLLKANVAGVKCAILAKCMHRSASAVTSWLDGTFAKFEPSVVEDFVAKVLVVQLDMVAETVFVKKISISYKFLDAILYLIHAVLQVINKNISCSNFISLYVCCLSLLNRILMSREELMEDRWPCYLQCYRSMVQALCGRCGAKMVLDSDQEEKFIEVAHSTEKLTQIICKKKSQISHLGAYTVADLCSWIEVTSPSRAIRQHLENCVTCLMQACDSTYSVAFLKRALANGPGYVTLNNVHTIYKRYHKYVGNA